LGQARQGRKGPGREGSREQPKVVIIGAFHTSNWDFVIGLFAAFMVRIKAYRIGKDNLFKVLLP
jgi:hypothetical protein